MARSAARNARMLGAIALACGTVPLVGATPAYADTATRAASSQGYFNASGVVTPEGSPQALPNVPASADGVNVGSLPVAAKANAEDKVSALFFDLFDLEPGTTVTKAVLTVPLSTAQGDVSSPNAAPAKVVACKAGPSGFGGEDGTTMTLAPERLCPDFEVKATASADGKAYVFDLTALAQEWVATANDGVILTSLAEARTEPFQVVFQPGDKAALAITYTAPPAVVAPPVVAPPVDTAPPVDLGGFSGGFAPTPPLDGGFVPMPGPAPAAVPAPVAQVPPAAVAPITTVAASQARPIESLRPDTSFWLGALGLGGLLALMSLVMGDGRIVQSTGARTRLAQALADRQRPAATPSAVRLSGRALSA